VLRSFARLGGLGLELIKVGLHRARHRARVGPSFRNLIRRRPPVPAGVGLDGAAIDQGAFASDETRLHAPADHHLEHGSQHVALGEAPMPVFGEARPVRHPALQPQTAKPAVSQVEVDLLTETRLRAEAVEIPHQQHADHQLGVDGRATDRTIERGEPGPEGVDVEKAVYSPEQVVGRNVVLKTELVEELLLRRQPTHHRRALPIPISKENHRSRSSSTTGSRGEPGGPFSPVSSVCGRSG
jgi:hypothetical protein